MPTIDAQVHCYERNHPGRPWHEVLAGPPEVTGEDMVKAMDEVGVDGALLVSVFTMYRWDASYALAVRKTHPDRFALIKPVDPNDPKVAETIAEWASIDGTVAIRIMMRPDVSTDAADPGINRVLAAAAKHDLPVNLLCWGRLDQAGQMAARNPDTQLVIDHLGLQQPFAPPAPAQPWADLPKLLALGRRENIAIKITGACTLSHQPFPYNDIWDPLARVRRLGFRPLPVGHGLDARRGVADLQAGRRGLSRDGPVVRQRPRHVDGRRTAEGLRLGAEEAVTSADLRLTACRRSRCGRRCR